MTAVLNAVDVLLAEVRHIRAAGPHFVIAHRFREPGSECLPGEEVFAVFLIYRGRDYQLPLATSQLLLFEYLARHSRLAQSANQIEVGIRADPFFREHATNANVKSSLVRRIPRSAVREHVKRVHDALAIVFHEANLPIDPRKVLVVKETVSNEVGYRLRATCHWTHTDLSTPSYLPFK